jgi:UDPglucose 6-dehydrogenase
VHELLKAGARVKVYDPVAMDNFKKQVKVPVEFGKNAYDAATGADAVVLVTEWNQFRELDFDRLKAAMRGRVFVDCRNVYVPARVEGEGFVYESFGRGKAR